MIQPTLGRIVWYTPSRFYPMMAGADGRCAAIITQVHGDRLVNLAVFDGDGHSRPAVNVTLVQPGDPTPSRDANYCEWMPYQLEKAKA